MGDEAWNPGILIPDGVEAKPVGQQDNASVNRLSDG